jgi:hypothetical protein
VEGPIFKTPTLLNLAGVPGASKPCIHVILSGAEDAAAAPDDEDEANPTVSSMRLAPAMPARNHRLTPAIGLPM